MNGKDSVNTDVSNGNVKHKAEATRQFLRYRIPAYVEIEGRRYRLNDWSVAGCSIVDLPDDILQRGYVVLDFICPFDTFEVVIKDIEAEFVRRDAAGNVGCRFNNLKSDQVALLQDIISAYLEGSIVSIDGFINTIKREDLREALEARRPTPPERDPVEETVRKIFVVSFLTLIVLILLVFLLEALHKRVYLVEPQEAFVDADLRVIRAPVDGIFKPKKRLVRGEFVFENQVLGVDNAPFAGGVVVICPVKGRIIRVNARNDDFLRLGDPIISVLPAGASIYVRANVLYKDVSRLHIGQKATIIKPNGEELVGRIVKIEASPTLESLHSTTVAPNYSFSWNYNRVIIAVPFGLNWKDIGGAVVVRIDVSPSLLKPIFKLLP